jgi:2-methylcitrate dehydratase PrpD
MRSRCEKSMAPEQSLLRQEDNCVPKPFPARTHSQDAAAAALQTIREELWRSVQPPRRHPQSDTHSKKMIQNP